MLAGLHHVLVHVCVCVCVCALTDCNKYNSCHVRFLRLSVIVCW